MVFSFTELFIFFRFSPCRFPAFSPAPERVLFPLIPARHAADPPARVTFLNVLSPFSAHAGEGGFFRFSAPFPRLAEKWSVLFAKTVYNIEL